MKLELENNDTPTSHILNTIQLIKDSFESSVIVYMHGSCIKLAMILKHIYPSGEILYDLDHAIFEYNGEYFDINGYAKKDRHVPLQDYGLLQAYKSMNLKYSVDKISRQKKVTRLITAIVNNWKYKDLNQVLKYAKKIIDTCEIVSENGAVSQYFICKGCWHKLPIDYQLKTIGYCYLCDPNISLKELLK